MADDIKRSRLVREMEQVFVPDYDINNMPSVDKRTAYALEHIAFRVGRIDQKLDQLIEALGRKG
jgi:hypothetical protein